MLQEEIYAYIQRANERHEIVSSGDIAERFNLTPEQAAEQMVLWYSACVSMTHEAA